MSNWVLKSPLYTEATWAKYFSWASEQSRSVQLICKTEIRNKYGKS